MHKTFHILNGDCLLDQFPEEIEGERIVMRECLVDGDLSGDDLNEFFIARAKFIATLDDSVTFEEYYHKSVPEFNRIIDIPAGSAAHLWFEDDLFCQVNSWFAAHLLFTYVDDISVFLVRPKIHTRYGFGGLSASELRQLLKEKVPVTELPELSILWEAYRAGDLAEMLRLAEALKGKYPFIYRAVEAHVARIPRDGNPGKPHQTLKAIIEELGTREFAPVFREFTRREPIYGFGDLQVKRMLDQVLKDL